MSSGDPKFQDNDPFLVPNIREDDLKVQDAAKYFKAVLNRVCIDYKVCIKFKTETCVEIIHLYNRELRKLKDDHQKGPNIYKRTAAMATWILRLKPIYVVEFADDNKMFPDVDRQKFAKRHLNEIFAMAYCIYMICKARPRVTRVPGTVCYETLPGLPEFDNFLANLRFRFLGVRQLATILRLCCENTLPSDD
jgi:hypothetical protein